MFNTPPMVDLRRTPEEKSELASIESYSPPDYPYGLCLSLDKDTLEKLEVDFDGVEIGETYHLFVMAKVTAKSRNESVSGEPRECIELQVTHMGAESEDEEDEASEPVHKKMYKKR